MALSTLPLEVQCQIAGWVESVHRPSLCAFSLTSKACHAASTSVIFRDINITVDHPEALHHKIERISQVLSRTDSSHHVRRINIKGALQLSVAETDKDNRKSWWEDDGLDEILDDEEWIDYSGRHIVYNEGVIEQASDEDLAWVPVANLLSTIPYLADLIYDCKSQFPPCLLETLQKTHPHCRLHHLTFRFRTLARGGPCPYEMALATSLYTVRVACASRDTEGEDDFNLEATMELAARLSPKLKEVEISSLQPILSHRYGRRREAWRGLPGFTGKTLGSLTSLSIKGLSALKSPTMLQTWAKHTDLSCLHHLTLGGSYVWKKNGMNAETMAWLAQNHSFPNARTLDIYINRDDMYLDSPHYTEHAVSLFQAFGPLEELSVNGPLDSQILEAILNRHGQTLKKLSLHPFEEVYHNILGARDVRAIPLEFTKERLLQIQARCPALEVLALPINREKSSAGEVEIYKCFGQMRSLHSLFLTLNCANWRLGRDGNYNPKFNEHDEKAIYSDQPYLKRGHLKEIMINCAVDEKLARSIWDTISQNKDGRRLVRLKLWTSGGGEYGGGLFDSWVTDILNNISRSWLIESQPRNHGEDIILKELGRQAREARDKRTNKRGDTEPKKIFEEIWPPKEGTESWHDDWSSLPLSV